MRRRDLSFTVALCLSLAAHAGLLCFLATQYSSQTVKTPPLAIAIRQEDQQPSPIFIPPPPPPPKIADDFGDKTGTGDAPAAAAGDKPNVARKALQEQPFLRRTPQSVGQVSDDDLATPRPSETGQGGNGVPVGAVGLAPSPVRPVPRVNVPKPPIHEKTQEPISQPDHATVQAQNSPTALTSSASPNAPVAPSAPSSPPAQQPAQVKTIETARMQPTPKEPTVAQPVAQRQPSVPTQSPSSHSPAAQPADAAAQIIAQGPAAPPAKQTPGAPQNPAQPTPPLTAAQPTAAQPTVAAPTGGTPAPISPTAIAASLQAVPAPQVPQFALASPTGLIHPNAMPPDASAQPPQPQEQPPQPQQSPAQHTPSRQVTPASVQLVPRPPQADPPTTPDKSAPTDPQDAPANSSAPAPPGNAGGTGAAGAPGTKAAGNPTPQSDSESDAASIDVGSVVFEPGRVNVRFGRKVRLVRPRLSLAGEYDTWTADGAIRVVVGVHIDETGAVTEVEILRSSGSNEIDLPCQRAVQQWWIEPAKDKNGKPRPDVIVVTLLID